MNTMTDPREWCACRSTYLLIYIRVLWSIPELHDTHVVSRTHFAPCSSYEKEKMISFFFFSFSDFFCIFFISKSIDKLGKSHRLIAVSTLHIYIYIYIYIYKERDSRFSIEPIFSQPLRFSSISYSRFHRCAIYVRCLPKIEGSIGSYREAFYSREKRCFLQR